MYPGSSCCNMLIIVCFIDQVVEKGLCLLLASSSPVLCYSIHVSNTVCSRLTIANKLACAALLLLRVVVKERLELSDKSCRNEVLT